MRDPWTVRTKRGQPEAEIRRDIRDNLRLLGFSVWDMEQNRPTRQTAGFPDLVVMGRGRILFAEIKTPKGRQNGAQKLFQAECEANGGEYVVWRTVNELVDWVERMALKKNGP